MIPRTPLVLIALFLTAGLCHYFDKPFDTGLVEDIKKAPFDHEAAVREMNFLSAEEHPFGSPRQKTLADHIVSVLSKQGFPAILQPLEVKTPNPQAFVRSGAPVNPVVKVTGQNIVVRTAPFFKKQPECVVLLASHYDSKSVAGVSYVGANDGGSSSVALLALLPLIRDLIVHHPMQCELIAVWFDGEE